MKKIHKIIIIVVIVIVISPVVVFFVGPVVFLVGSNLIGSLLMDSVSDSDFEKEIMHLDEVKLFYEKYHNPEISYFRDFIAWRGIWYSVMDSDGNQRVDLFIKKSVLHGGIRMQLSCVYDVQSPQELDVNYEQEQQKVPMNEYTPSDDSESTIHLSDRDEITKHLKNKNCFEN